MPSLDTFFEYIIKYKDALNIIGGFISAICGGIWTVITLQKSKNNQDTKNYHRPATNTNSSILNYHVIWILSMPIRIIRGYAIGLLTFIIKIIQLIFSSLAVGIIAAILIISTGLSAELRSFLFISLLIFSYIYTVNGGTALGAQGQGEDKFHARRGLAGLISGAIITVPLYYIYMISKNSLHLDRLTLAALFGAIIGLLLSPFASEHSLQA